MNNEKVHFEKKNPKKSILTFVANSTQHFLILILTHSIVFCGKFRIYIATYYFKDDELFRLRHISL